MAGVVAALPVEATFVGDASLSRRPMRRVAKPLEAMGAKFDLPAHGGLPMTVRGGALHDIEWKSEIASAQVKSALLLAGLVSGSRVKYEEPIRTRDHTEQMLRERGVTVRVDGTRVELNPPASLRAIDTRVPGDPSSAAFFVALAALADGGTLALEDVCLNETRTGFLNVVKRMGAAIQVDGSNLAIAPGDLRGVEIHEAEVPSMIDELPMLACLASQAGGETVITGAHELRVKESDRIAAVVSNLRAIGVDADELPDGMRIRGKRQRLAGRVVTHGDHRLAMAFGILGAATGNGIDIDDRACVNVSYPGFWEDLARVTRA
jgi:3-phosphoshikimate 1-carboxyvinyltransferase